MRSTLRPHQIEALSQLKSSILAGNKRPMVQAPTGFGKTILAAAITEGAALKGNRVIFVVPALSLIDQTVAAFWHEGITDVGVIQADHTLTDWSKPIQVASVQTLQRRRLPEAEVVVIDEAHRWFRFYGEWMKRPQWQDVPFIGLSATPWTRGLGKHFDDLIIAATTKDLIDAGYLSNFRVFAPAHPDLTGVKTVAGDYHEGQLAEAMNQDVLVADVVETWLKLGEDRPTLCFGVDRAHAKHLQQQFERAGVPCGYQDAFTDAAERAQIKAAFEAGRLKVVCNVGTLTTGVDWDVRCIILARPTKSEILFTQIIGRGLRTAPGKDDCLILDHSDTHLRLGFVTDIHHTKLDDGSERQPKKPGDQVRLPKECSKCSYLKPPKVAQCPSCGFKPEPRTDVEHEDGELSELTPKRKQVDKATKQLWYSGFLRVAQERGYKKGWAANQYRQKFGVWPRGLDEYSTEPTPEVRNYVKASLIRFAKRREREKQGGAHVHAA